MIKIVTKSEYERLIAIEQKKIAEEREKARAKAEYKATKRKYKQLKRRKIIRVVKVIGGVAKTTGRGFARMGKAIKPIGVKALKNYEANLRAEAKRKKKKRREFELPF